MKKMKKRKGQLFLVLGIVVVTVLILLKTSMKITEVLENKRFFEAGLERLEFQNLRSEAINSARISINQTQNLSKNVNNFLAFAKEAFSGRALDFKGIAIESIFPKVVSNTDTRMNVSVFNFLGVELQTLILNFTYDLSPQTFSSVSSGTTITTNFTFNTNTAINYTLWVYWKTLTESETENITIPVEIGKSKFIVFFDLRLSSERLEQRDKFTETFTLS